MRSGSGLNIAAVILLFAFCFTVIPAPGLYAGMMDTGTMLENGSDDVRVRLNQMLDKQEVRQALRDRGVSADEARARLAALSDSQLRRVAGELDSMPSGQGVGSLVGAAVFIFLVLLFTDILGFTDVFPFVNSQR